MEERSQNTFTAFRRDLVWLQKYSNEKGPSFASSKVELGVYRGLLSLNN